MKLYQIPIRNISLFGENSRQKAETVRYFYKKAINYYKMCISFTLYYCLYFEKNFLHNKFNYG
jgi:hypothetical protein